jgi:hypothetical protein
MKRILVLILVATFFSCSDYGEKITRNGTEVYFEDESIKETAEIAATYLEDMGFTDGTPKSVQITKDSIYNFRMVVQKGAENDKSMDVNFMALGFLLSKEVFDGEDINFQLCDNRFETLRTIPIEGLKTAAKD